MGGEGEHNWTLQECRDRRRTAVEKLHAPHATTPRTPVMSGRPHKNDERPQARIGGRYSLWQHIYLRLLSRAGNHHDKKQTIQHLQAGPTILLCLYQTFFECPFPKVISRNEFTCWPEIFPTRVCSQNPLIPFDSCRVKEGREKQGLIDSPAPKFISSPSSFLSFSPWTRRRYEWLRTQFYPEFAGTSESFAREKAVVSQTSKAEWERKAA